MSLKKQSLAASPSIKDINHLTATMTMDEIRKTQVFHDMPKSIYVSELGRSIPKSALRRKDLAAAYLMHGGKVIKQQRKELKHFRPSIKKTSLEKKLDRHRQSLKKDHKGSVKHLRHESSSLALSLQKPVRFHAASHSFRTPTSDGLDEKDSSEHDKNDDDDDDMDAVATDLQMTLSLQDHPKRSRRSLPAWDDNNVDNDF